MSTITETLTPYDKGTRAEPRIWPTPGAKEFAGAPPLQQRLYERDYGKVDFDDDESATLATVWLERDEAGRAVVHVQPLGVDAILVQVHS